MWPFSLQLKQIPSLISEGCLRRGVFLLLGFSGVEGVGLEVAEIEDLCPPDDFGVVVEDGEDALRA
jgi:hypothetical protein